MKYINFLIFSFCITLGFAQTRYYVAPNGSGNGSTWQNAINLEQALFQASEGSELWLLAGDYYITKTAVVKLNVKVYGGFAGTEQSLNQRNYATNVSAIDGGLKFRVVELQSGGLLDGLTIQNGFARSLDVQFGGGVYMKSGSVISNCKIRMNKAVSIGGGVYSEGEGQLLNCLIEGNQSGYNGTAIYGDSLFIINNTIVNNLHMYAQNSEVGEKVFNACKGQLVVLEVADEGHYEWCNGSDERKISIIATKDTVYSVMVTTLDSTYAYYLEFQIIVNDPPQKPFCGIVDNNACDGSNGQINISSPIGDNYSYSLNGKDFSKSPRFSGMSVGEYKVIVQDEHRCFSDSSYKIENKPIITPNVELLITPNDSLCEANNTVTIKAKITNAVDPKLTWMKDFKLQTDTIDTITQTLAVENNRQTTYQYSLIVTDRSSGCLESVGTFIHVFPQIKIIKQAVSKVVCQNNLAELYLEASLLRDSIIYKWESSTDGINFTPINLQANSHTYNAPTAQVGLTHYRCMLTSKSNVCDLQYSDIVTVNVTPQPRIKVYGDSILCSGENTKLWLENFDPTFSYLWKYNNDTLSKTDTLIFLPYLEKTNINISVSTPNCEIQSQVLVKLQYPPQIDWKNGTGAPNQIVCYNVNIIPIVFDVKNSNKTQITWLPRAPQGITYDESTHKISGVTTDNGEFTYVIKSNEALAECAFVEYRNKITFLADIAPGKIGNDHSICIGEHPQNMQEIQGSSGGSLINSYQWQDSVIGGVFEDIHDAKEKILQDRHIRNETTYFRRVRINTCGTIVSNIITLTVNPLPDDVEVLITPNKMCDKSAYGNGKIVFTSPIGNNYTYYVNDLETPINHPLLSSLLAQTYKVGVKNEYGCYKSKLVTIVDNLVHPTVSISVEGDKDSICVSKGSFELEAHSNVTDCTYEWQDGSDNKKYQVSNIKGDSNYLLTVSVFDNVNKCKSEYISKKIMVMSPNSIKTQPKPTKSCLGQTITFSVEGTKINSKYQWETKYPGAADFKEFRHGEDYSTLPSITPVYDTVNDINRDGTEIRCKVWSSDSICPYISSDIVVMNLYKWPEPSITGEDALCFGESTTLEAVCVATSEKENSYSWTSSSSGRPVNTTKSLTIQAVATANYTVTVSNGYCSKNASKVVEVNPSAIIKASDPLLLLQNVCWNTPFKTISFELTHATTSKIIWENAKNAGLSYDENTHTLSGTPNQTGIFRYTIQTQDHGQGCEFAEVKGMFTVFNQSVAAVVTSDQTICYGTSPEEFKVINEPAESSPEPSTYQWYKSKTDNDADGYVQVLEQNNKSFNDTAHLTATRLYKRQTNNSCGTIWSNTVTVTVNPELPIIQADITPNSTCDPTPLGEIEITNPVNSANYDFSLDHTTWQTSNKFTGLFGGDYSICIRDKQGCTGEHLEVKVGTVIGSPTFDLDVTPNDTICSDRAVGDSVIIKIANLDIYVADSYTTSWNDGKIKGIDSIIVLPRVRTAYKLELTNDLGCVTVKNITINVLKAIEYNIHPVADTSVCLGAFLELHAGANLSGETRVYKWEKNDENDFVNNNHQILPGINGSVAVIPTDEKGVFWYRSHAELHSGTEICNFNHSTSTKVNVYDPPTVSIDVSDDLICSGQEVTLTANSAKTSDKDNTYLWSSGETTSSITRIVNQNTVFWVTVNNGYCTRNATKEITVQAKPIISVIGDNTLLNSQEICHNTPLTPIKFKLDNSNGIQFEWTSPAIPTGISFDNIQYILSGTANISTRDTLFSFKVSTIQSNKCASVSLTGKFIVFENLTPGIIQESQDFCGSGNPNIFTQLEAGGGGDPATRKYQWQNSTDNLTFDAISGATQIQYDPKLLTETTYFRRINKNNCKGPDTISNVLKIGIHPIPTPPQVTVSPDQACVVNQANGKLEVTSPLGSEYEYTLNKSTWTANPVVATGLVAGKYMITVRNKNTGCESSIEKEVTNVPLNPVFTVDVDPNDSICAGTSFTLSAILGANTSGATYQWLIGADFVGTNSTYTRTLNGDTVIYLYIINQLGCSNYEPISMRVRPKVKLDPNFPHDIQSCVGGGSSILEAKIKESGESLRYSWEKSTTSDFSSYEVIERAQNAQYTIPSGDFTNAYFRCKVEGESRVCPGDYSRIAQVQLWRQPAPIIESTEDVICAGESTTLTATNLNAEMLGSGFVYEWILGGVKVGTTNPVIVKPTTKGDNVYTLKVDNGYCSQSVTKTIEVKSASSIGLSAGSGSLDQTLCVGSSITPIFFDVVNANSTSISWTPSVLVEAQHGGTSPKDSLKAQDIQKEGSYKYTITTVGSCSSAKISGTISVQKGFPQPIFPDSVRGCYGDNLIISPKNESWAEPGVTYEWVRSKDSLGPYVKAPVDYPHTYEYRYFSFPTDGNYYYRRIMRGVCEQWSKPVKVYGTQSSQPGIFALQVLPGHLLCVGDTLTLEAGHVLWSMEPMKPAIPQYKPDTLDWGADIGIRENPLKLAFNTPRSMQWNGAKTRIRGDENCFAELTQRIEYQVFANPNLQWVGGTIDTSVEAGQLVKLEVTAPGSSFSWSTGASSSNLEYQIPTDATPGMEYKLSVTASERRNESLTCRTTKSVTLKVKTPTAPAPKSFIKNIPKR